MGAELNLVPQTTYNGTPFYVNRVSKRERNIDEKVFRDAQKQIGKTGIRSADWGLYAAQSCLARDLVNADPDELPLIGSKMTYVHNLINENLQIDSSISKDGIQAKAVLIPAQAELIKAKTDAATKLIHTTGDTIKTAVPAIVPTVKALNVLS